MSSEPQPSNSQAPSAASPAAQQNVRLVAEIEQKSLNKRSFSERVSDGIVGFIGTLAAFMLHVVVIGIWAVVNLGLIPGVHPFDPYPFGLLTMFVSLESALLVIFVLISQNRMTRQADRRAHLDLQVSMLAEQELTVGLNMLRKLCEKHGISLEVKEEEIQEMAQKTDVASMAKEVEEKMPE